MPLTEKHVQFPNLNGIRFIAAFAVFIHHIEQIKQLLGCENHYYGFVSQNMGKLGVALFFVLSGFLITYLLLDEKNRNGKINTKNFYIRRILRIWPLYFIIFILSFFIFPQFGFLKEPHDFILWDNGFIYRFLLFLFFLPNFAIVFFGSPYLCTPTWSIGIEEQFYAIWPWIVGSKNPLKSLLKAAVIFGSIIGLLWVVVFYTGLFGDEAQNIFKTKLLHFLGQFRILAMIIGAGGAHLVYFKKTYILNILYRKDIQIMVYIILLGLLLINFHPDNINLEFYGLFFCFLIINVATNPESLINLNNPIMEYLGKISYGIYIYHSAVIMIVINIIKTYLNPNLSHSVFNILTYVFSTIFTVIVCHISYKFIEEPLLKMKSRFIY